jgi:hypothetical protein
MFISAFARQNSSSGHQTHQQSNNSRSNNFVLRLKQFFLVVETRGL